MAAHGIHIRTPRPEEPLALGLRYRKRGLHFVLYRIFLVLSTLESTMSSNHTLAELNEARQDEVDSPRGDDASDSSQPVTLAPFLSKLHEILSKGEDTDSIRWGEG